MRSGAVVWGLFAVTRVAAVFFLCESTDVTIYARYAAGVRAHGPAGFAATETVEYPALAVAAMLPPSYLADALPEGVERIYGLRRIALSGTAADRYQVAFQLLFLPCDLLVLVAVGRTATRLYPNESPGRHAVRRGLYVLGTGAMAAILYDRLDLAVGGFALAAVAAVAAGRPGLVYPVLAAGVLFKIVPGLLLPVAVLFAAVRGPGPFAPRLLKHAVVAAAWLGLGVLLAAAAFGPGAFKFLAYHADRGVQIQACYGWPIPLLDPATDVVHDFGSHNFRGSLAGGVAAVSTGVLLLCVGSAYAAAAAGVRRVGPAPDRLALAFAAVLLAYILGNKVGSPQYMLWLAPLVPLLPLDTYRARVWAAGFVVLCAWTSLGFPFNYIQMTGLPDPAGGHWAGPTPAGTALLAVQSGLLFALTATALERAAGATPRGSVA